MAQNASGWDQFPIIAPAATAATGGPAVVGSIAGNPRQPPPVRPIQQAIDEQQLRNAQLEAQAKEVALKKAREADNPAFAPGDTTKTGADYLATLAPPLAAQVKALAEGRRAFPTGAALRSPQVQELLAAATQYDPTLDAANAATRVATRKDFTSGKAAANITAMNTALGHLGSLADAAAKLGNSSFPIWNSIANTAESQFGDPRVKNFTITRDAVANELMKVFRNTGGSVSEIEEWKHTIDSSDSPEQLHATILRATELLRSRLEAMNDQYARGMGTSGDPIELLSPHAQEVFNAISSSTDLSGIGGLPPSPDQPPNSPLDPEGRGDIGFASGASNDANSLPPGAQEFQREFQQLANAGQFRTAEDIVHYGAQRGFTIDPAQAAGAIDALRKGGVVAVNTPTYKEADISVERGAGGVGETVQALGRGIPGAFGLDDELGAFIDTLSGGTLRENLAHNRQIRDYDEENHGVARFAGELVGGVAAGTSLPNVAQNAARRAAFAAAREALASGASREAAQAAGQAAGRAAFRKIAAGEGAAYGAEYGFADSDGSIGDRALGAAASAPVGAAGSFALTAIGPSVGVGARRVGQGIADKFHSTPDANQIAAARAASDLGIEMPRFVAGGPSAQRTASAVEQSPFGAATISGAVKRMLDQADTARDAITSSVGTPKTLEGMGETALKGGVAGVKQARTAASNRYRVPEQMAQGVDVAPQQTMQRLGELIRADAEVPGGTKLTPVLKRYAAAFENVGPVTIAGARKMRGELRRVFENEADLSPSDAKRLTGHIMGAVNDDISNALKAAGKPDAARLYREADKGWAEYHALKDDVLTPYIGKDGDNWGAEVARRIVTDAKGNGVRLAQYLAAIPKDEAQTVRATLIDRLGRSKPGSQDAEGDAFSLDTFLTNWNEIKETRNLFFDRETVDSLSKLAQVAERAKAAGRLRNHSNTGGVNIINTLTTLPTVVGATMAGAGNMTTGVLTALGSGLMALGQSRAAHLLASPDFAKKLAATPMNPKAAASFWSRPWVAQMAKSNPAIAADIAGFQKAVLSAANDNVAASGKLAASPDERPEQKQQRRP